MLLGYLMAFLKDSIFSSNTMKSSCCTVVMITILAMAGIIIGKCFLAFALFDYLRVFCDLPTVLSCCITAVAFMLTGVITLMILSYTINKKVHNNVVVSKYEDSKRVLSAFLDGLSKR